MSGQEKYLCFGGWGMKAILHNFSLKIFSLLFIVFFVENLQRTNKIVCIPFILLKSLLHTN